MWQPKNEGQAEAQREELTGLQLFGRCCGNHWSGVVLFLTPVICFPLLFFEPKHEYRCLFVLLLMATYWITEVMPLGVTSMIPIILFPVMGITDTKTVCMIFFKDSLILFFGGMIVAFAIEYSNLHKRVAINVILCVGCSPRRLHFSLMMVTMFVSMWISNAPATAMMCPVIKAVLEQLAQAGMISLINEEKDAKRLPDDPPYPSNTVICFYCGIAYAASAGGLGTLIGTGTNLVFKGIYDVRYPEAKDIDFTNWMEFNIPIMLTLTLCFFFVLHWQLMGLFRKNNPLAGIGQEGADLARKVILEKRDELGPLNCHEVSVGILFLMMVTLFLTRKPGSLEGWGTFLNAVDIKNSAPVILVCILFFLLPINYACCKYFIGTKPELERTIPGLITWKFIHTSMPWGIILLLGGGFALSAGIKDSGLAHMVGVELKVVEILPPPAVQLLCIALAVFLTAFTANMAACNIMIPILLEMASAIEVHPAYLGLPATLGLSMAFHFPVSTPANAIIAGFAKIRTVDMARAGIGPSTIAILAIFFYSQTYSMLIFPTFREFPEWAKLEEH